LNTEKFEAREAKNKINSSIIRLGVDSQIGDNLSEKIFAIIFFSKHNFVCLYSLTTDPTKIKF